MPEVNVVTVLVAAVVAFVLAAAYYLVLGGQLAEESDAAAAAGPMPPWKVAAELTRGLLVALVVAGLAAAAEIDEWTGGLLLGLALWIGFPIVLWIGAVIHEGTSWKLAAIHAGDWLVKLLAVALIVSVWQ
ncbi:MAG TPA: DUF1761 domain-containing protein [Actinomycetes bacterium]|nr:DUF1761 domain-containing protein [Actinomycetes bacterium]